MHGGLSRFVNYSVGFFLMGRKMSDVVLGFCGLGLGYLEFYGWRKQNVFVNSSSVSGCIILMCGVIFQV